MPVFIFFDTTFKLYFSFILCNFALNNNGHDF